MGCDDIAVNLRTGQILHSMDKLIKSGTVTFSLCHQIQILKGKWQRQADKTFEVL